MESIPPGRTGSSPCFTPQPLGFPHMSPSRGSLVSVEFDDVIFALQQSGGASVYWRELTTRIASDGRFLVSRIPASKRKRGIPAFSRADVFHSSHFRFAAIGGAKNVSTVHDLNYELGLVAPGLGSSLNLLERRISYFSAAALICISENTRMDLFQVYPGLQGKCPVFVIHHGVSLPPAASGEPSSPVPEYPFLLFVGGRKAYKNFTTALEGYHASLVWRSGVRLLCTGAPLDAEEAAKVTRLGLAGMVSSVGHCSPHTLFALYRTAHCLLYTSTYEGFGLPPLEAMACGCPVIASRASSIPEVTGDAAILVTPQSADEVARAILALQDPTLRTSLAEKGSRRAAKFSWDESARKHGDVYLSVRS
jgi:glycosyltransferase involved in cell wall biosynthesis